jgi:hypothetical protein
VIDRGLHRAANIDEDGWEYAPDFPYFARAKFFENKAGGATGGGDSDKDWFYQYLVKVEGIPHDPALEACKQLVEHIAYGRPHRARSRVVA